MSFKEVKRKMSARQSLRKSSSMGRSTSPFLSSTRNLNMSKTVFNKRQSLSKKKEKLYENDTVNLADIELARFCPQKIFNVLFINETDEYSKEVMEKIIEASKELEDVSFLTFITYDEVVSIIDNCEEAVLPPTMKSFLTDISKLIKDKMVDRENMPPLFLAKLMKLKLIEVMYKHYAKAVTKMQRKKKLVADLKALIGDQPGKGKGVKKSDSKSSINLKKNISQMVTQVAFDYTTVPLDSQDDIIFDDDIHHHIAFYIFQGFYDPELFQELIAKCKVDVQSVIKFTALDGEESSPNAAMSNFWAQAGKYFDGPRRKSYLENTFLMNYSCKGDDIKSIFEGILYVVRNISKIKLQHLNFIRHTEIFQVREIYNYFPLACFTVYNNFLQKFPMELVNVPIILDTLLKQVSVSVDETSTFLDNVSQHSYFSSHSFEQIKCTYPCSLEAFFKNKGRVGAQLPSIGKKTRSFLTHEKDGLNIILNSYKKVGAMVHEITTTMLKKLQVLKDFNAFEPDGTDIIHKHDRDPSTKTVLRDDGALLHFLYLFLFSLFKRGDNLPNITETELTKNLETYNKLRFIADSQVAVQQSDSKERKISNLYNIAPTQFFWSEKLETPVLLQELERSQEEYLYWEQRISPETDTVLIQFSNRLDEFGTNTKIYDESLLTPLCIRDFCKYTTVYKGAWLEKNEPPKYIRKCVVREECQGAKKVIENQRFPEYRHLIEAGGEEEQPHIGNQDAEISFEQLVDELKNYPPNSKLMKECAKLDQPNKFLAYDFGTKFFQVKGSRTTFHSHDGVKLSIDNTAFLDECAKCSVNLSCGNNSLVLHSDSFYMTEPFNFHMNLADGTIISFIFPKHSKHAQSFKSKESVVFEKACHEEREQEFTAADIDYVDPVRSVDQSYFETLTEYNLLNEEYCSSTEISFKHPDSILQRLKEAATSKVPIYKVNSDTTLVKRLKSEFEIPFPTIVKRLLHNTVRHEEADCFTKRFVPVKQRKYASGPKVLFDTRISLPNGLYVTFYPSKFKKDFLEVKQEFLCGNASTKLEEFRLFSRGGYILIKKIDGSILTYRANGDIVEHEKLDVDPDGVRRWSTKPCHCKNIEDYKKRLSKLFRNQNEEYVTADASRSIGYHTRKAYILNPMISGMITTYKIPYLKNSLLKFEGNRVCLQKGKLKIKKVLHVTSEHNFAKQEIYYERSDGVKCTIDAYGSQLVEFIDGTKIKSLVHVAKDLVDGYVYITIESEFQHPNFATVVYKFDNSIEVLLNNNVVFKNDSDEVSVSIGKEIVTTVNKENVSFEKHCAECEGRYTCDINIHPLVSGDMLLPSDTFLNAQDTYNKRLSSDFYGFCKRNHDFLEGPLNAFKCNHYKNQTYKRLFVVNRNLSGSSFWTDDMVVVKRDAINGDEDGSLRELNDDRNTKILIYKFKRNVYEHYNSRFLNQSMQLSRSLLDNSKELIYSTFCTVRRMLDIRTIEKFCQDLSNYFEASERIGPNFYKALDKMKEAIDLYDLRGNDIDDTKTEVVEEETCKCVKQKLSIQEKIERWWKECEKYRALIRQDVPCYFNSPFCKTIKTK